MRACLATIWAPSSNSTLQRKSESPCSVDAVTTLKELKVIATSRKQGVPNRKAHAFQLQQETVTIVRIRQLLASSSHSWPSSILWPSLNTRLRQTVCKALSIVASFAGSTLIKQRHWAQSTRWTRFHMILIHRLLYYTRGLDTYKTSEGSVSRGKPAWISVLDSSIPLAGSKHSTLRLST